MNQLKADGHWGWDINGYTDLAASRKLAFMREAGMFLRSVAKVLADEYGLDHYEMHKNAGGVAVSGDVYAYFWKDVDPTHRVYATIGTSSVGNHRKDHVTLMIRTQRVSGDHAKVYGKMGPNIWLDPNSEAAEVATHLYNIYIGEHNE